MPVILTKETRKLWLDHDATWGKVYSKLYECNPKDLMSYYKVANVVNSIRNDISDCTMKAEEYEKKLHS